MTTDLLKFNWHDKGIADFDILVSNIETVRDAMDETERLRDLLSANIASMYPLSITTAVETFGSTTVLEQTQRADMKLTHAHIVAGGVSDVDTTISLLKNGTDELTERLTLKSSEGTGKVKIAEVNDYITLSRFDTIDVKSDSNRKMVITMNFGSV